MSAPLVVAGAGIGGLTAALCLVRAGRRVTVIERAHLIEEVGAGLQIAPNAGRILAELGLEPAMRAASLEPRAIVIRRAADAGVLARLPLEQSRARFGAPFRVFHRADLQNLLLTAAQSAGDIEIRTGTRVGAFGEAGDLVRLELRGDHGPETLEAAGLVGADGVRSAVRAHMIPSPADAPAYAGCTAWRALIPAADVPASLRERESNLWLMPGAHVVHYPLRDGEIVNVVVIVEDAASGGAANASLGLGGAELAQALGGARLHADLRGLIEAAGSFRHWPLFMRPKLARWSRGAVTLLGDAAHPMVPFLAQGAAQAIEDAQALGAAIGQLGATPAGAFAAYERARMARAGKVQSASARQGVYFHMRGPVAFARDFAIRTLGGDGMMARNAWLYR